MVLTIKMRTFLVPISVLVWTTLTIQAARPQTNIRMRMTMSSLRRFMHILTRRQRSAKLLSTVLETAMKQIHLTGAEKSGRTQEAELRYILVILEMAKKCSPLFSGLINPHALKISANNPRFSVGCLFFEYRLKLKP